MSDDKRAGNAQALGQRTLGILGKVRSRASSSGLVLGLAICIILFAFALRLHHLVDRDIWWDEGWSVWLARQDILSSASRTASDEHPPLHYWLLHLWDPLSGESEFAVRFSSVVFAILAVVLVNRLGTELVNRPTGILASLLLALSRFHIWLSQEIRMYALAIFLSLLSLYLFVRILRGGGARLWIAYVMVSTACLYTLYLTFFVLAVENLAFFALLTLERQRRSWQGVAKWALAQFAILLLFLPWLYFYYTHAITFERFEPFDPLLFFRLYATVLPLGISTNIEDYEVLAILFLVLAGVGIFGSLLSGRASERRTGLLLGLTFLALPVGIFAFSLPQQAIFHPKVMARYLVLFIPMYCLILSQGIRFFWRRNRLAGGAVLVLVLVCFSFTLKAYFAGRHRTYDHQAMATLIEAQAKEGDAIVLNSDSDWPVYAYHIKVDLPWFRIPSGARMTPEEADHWLAPVAKHSTVWLLTTEKAATSDPKGEVKTWLSGHFNKLGEVAYGKCQLSLFSWDESRDFCTVSASGLSMQHSRPSRLGDISFLGYDRLPGHLRTGDTLYLTSYWQALEDPEGDVQVRLSLIDSEGNRLISRTPISPPGKCHWPKDGVVQMQHRLAIGPSIPSGLYRLSLNVGEPVSGELLTIPVTTLRIEAEETLRGHDAPSTSTSVVLDDNVRLLGYSLSPDPIDPGQKLHLTLFWEALSEMNTSYTVFVHLLNEANGIWDQRDSIPGQGLYPTTGWMEGDLIRDGYTFDIPLDVKPDQVTIVVGMYDLATGVRLPLSGKTGQAMQENRVVILESVRIEK